MRLEGVAIGGGCLIMRLRRLLNHAIDVGWSR